MDERQTLIDKAKQVAETLGTKKISRADFARETGISLNQVYQHFDGWRELCHLAGLEPHMQNVRIDDDELFWAMRDSFIKLGGITTRTKFDREFPYSVDVFKKRGLNWSEALMKFREWCQTNAREFPYLAELPNESDVVNRGRANTPRVSAKTSESTWDPSTGKVLGDFLHFRGLQHAPVNEQGVVFLFGMIAKDLGYSVESVQTGYPDCDAKRRVGSDRWERVRVEFEYKSRSFRDHGHDPGGCDVIVCWEHNYPECPVEVLELREAIKDLPSD